MYYTKVSQERRVEGTVDASHEYTRRSERIRGRANEQVPIVCTRRRRRRRRRRQRGRTAIVRATTLPNGSLKDESCRVIFAPMMIVERIRRRRRRLRASKGESTHIASRDDASQKANTSPRRSGVRADARVREPRFCTRARARLIKWSVTCFPLFFSPFLFLGVGCWVFDTKEMRTYYYMRIVCVRVPHTTRTQWKASSYAGSHSIATCAFWAFVVAPPKTLLHLALPSFEALPPKNGKTVVRDVRRPRRLDVSKA